MAGDGEVVVPPTLQALLAARLDRLEEPERAVLECAAVEGEIFHRGAVQALVPDEPQVTPRLAGLVRKELIAPEQAQVPGEDGFRFRHLLIRDAAYEALPKARRADLHQRFAGWLEDHSAPVELDELLGYHLEQAVRYRLELGESANVRVAAAARERLTAAGRRSLRRLDFGSAAGFLERAADLAPAGELDLGLETDLIDALSWDRKGEEALSRARSIVSRAAAAGDRIGELCGRIHETAQRMHMGGADVTADLEALIAEALPVFEAAGNDLALRIAYRAIGESANMRAQMDQVAAAYEQALSYPGPAGLTALVGYQSHGRYHGSTPLTELLAWQDEQEPGEQRGYWLRAHRSGALAMLGRSDEARSLLAELRDRARRARRRAGGARGDRRPRPRDRAPRRRSGRRRRGRLGELPPARGAEPLVRAVDDRRRAGRGVLRARPARRGRAVGSSCRGARNPRRRRHPDALAAGAGEGARPARRARGGGAPGTRGGRDRRDDRRPELEGGGARRPR